MKYSIKSSVYTVDKDHLDQGNLLIQRGTLVDYKKRKKHYLLSYQGDTEWVHENEIYPSELSLFQSLGIKEFELSPLRKFIPGKTYETRQNGKKTILITYIFRDASNELHMAIVASNRSGHKDLFVSKIRGES